MQIGSRIQSLRKAAGLTQAELAEKMQVSFQTVSGWERNEYFPDARRLADLARVLNTRLDVLTAEEEPPRWTLHDRLFSEDRMYTFVKATAAARGYTQTLAALPFAAEKHAGQYRKGADRVPYINHPLTTACHALAMNLEDEIVAASLLHDVCEDCGVRPEKLPADSAVQEAVRLLSFTMETGESRQQAKARYFGRIAENRIAAIVKAIDRCSNVSTMASGFTSARIVEYIDETETYILPLLEEIKDRYPEFYNAAFLLKYHIRSILETLKRTL